MRALFRQPLHLPLGLVRGAFASLPPQTQTHARAAAREGWLALRSLADGSTDATERTIDRVSRLISGSRPPGYSDADTRAE